MELVAPRHRGAAAVAGAGGAAAAAGAGLLADVLLSLNIGPFEKC